MCLGLRSTFVAYLWALRDAPTQPREGIVAAAGQELVINLHEESYTIFAATSHHAPGRSRARSYRVRIGGPSSSIRARHASIIGVHFNPGGAFPFLAVPLGELADEHVDLDVLWGTDAHRLRERLLAVRGNADRFRILEDARCARLRRAPNRHSAVQVGVDGLVRGACALRDIHSHVSLSRRRFIEVFARESA